MRSTLGLAVALSALLAGPVAAQPIYRCQAPNGGTIYQDAPCVGGTALDVPRSAADPAAIERLKRESAAFDARQAARDAAAQRADEARERARRDAAATEAPSSPADLYAPLYAPWYAPPYPPRPRPPGPRPRPPQPTPVVPAR